ncbi:MAG TPA: hypothetical protein VGH88_13970 [Streptosporangiaceae bacterium]
MAALLSFFLLAGPAAAVAAGSTVDHAMLGQVRAQQGWHQVTATLIHPTARRVDASSPSNWVLQSALATWTVAGRTHTGWIPLAAPPAKAGTAPVWVDADGQPSPPPSAYSNLHLAVAVAAVAAALAVAAILFFVGLASRVLLDRRRMTAWDTAWRAIGPQWSRQL